MTESIRNDATGPRVDRAEQRLDRIVEPDDERRCTERLEILRDKAHPQLLACANDDDREQQDDNVAFEREDLRQSLRCSARDSRGRSHAPLALRIES